MTTSTLIVRIWGTCFRASVHRSCELIYISAMFHTTTDIRTGRYASRMTSEGLEVTKILKQLLYCKEQTVAIVLHVLLWIGPRDVIREIYGLFSGCTLIHCVRGWAIRIRKHLFFVYKLIKNLTHGSGSITTHLSSWTWVVQIQTTITIILELAAILFL